MSANSRQPKPQRKGADTNIRRIPAWSGSRASPTFSPANTPARLPPNGPPTQAPKDPGAFPPLAQTNGAARPSDAERVLQALTGLIGTTVTLTTKTGQRYEGVVGSTSAEGDTNGLTLKDVKELSSPGAPLKDQIFIASTNIDVWSSGPADAKALNGDSFKTDTDISKKAGGRERELTAWSADDSNLPANTALGTGDEATFGTTSGNTSWDQFAANEKMFGVKTSFDENLYTTKLDRNAADFKERERKAQQIANEIMGSTSSNPHIREERSMDHADDSGINEEDKYGAVVRSANAYVPPGARRPGFTSEETSKAEVPKVSINAPDGSTVTPAAKEASVPATKPSADTAFRDFVTNEKQRLSQKKQALMKNERDKRMADFVKFSQSFKLKKPIPDDLVPILAKDEDKQRLIREKTTQDAVADSTRPIGANGSAVAPSAAGRVQQQGSAPKPTNGMPTVKAVPSTSAVKTPAKAEPPTKRNSLFIQPIPAFRGRKSTTPVPPSSQNESPGSPTAKLNVNASSFKPNPKAVAFTPSVSPANANGPSAANASPKPKPAEAQQVSSKPNPFFGTQITKKNASVHMKDDFNPFKYHKVAEASAINAMWPYNGKRYLHMFPMQSSPGQTQSPHMAPPPTAPAPPSYEEDSAAQQAAAAQSRGYVYAYPPYYPGQPMMPGMAPPPPGAYMPSPYMHPMHYQHAMPPNGMYPSPNMGQMPPPGAYMPPPPPPGAYPPPPNSAGPRPSMPPTPIPAHAHPYYTQSPQMQHAVPYPMMMPPGQHVQHPYEGSAPPVSMGGHA